ncbi:hypothetical protein INR49_025247, partial [Caranx melampygus]
MKALEYIFKFIVRSRVLFNQYGAALKYIPTIVNDVKLVFDPKELSKLFTEFILKVPLGRLVKQKLDCLIDIVHSDLFTHHVMPDMKARDVEVVNENLYLLLSAARLARGDLRTRSRRNDGPGPSVLLEAAVPLR